MALKNACEWYRRYLLLRLPVIRMAPGDERRHVVTWQDAAGESRLVAAVLREGETYTYTSWLTPDSLWAKLLPRSDH